MPPSVDHPDLPSSGVSRSRLSGVYRAAVVILLGCTATLAQEPTPDQTAGAGDAEEESWLDGSYENIDETSDDLAVWFDSFFGLPREVEEEASSIVRLRPELKWDEDDGTDLKLRVTGRVHLPRTSDRLSLVFSGEDGDFEDELYDPSVSTGGDSAAGLQYQVRRKKRSSAYLFAGLKAGPNVKLGGRYRIQDRLLEKGQYRFSEEVFWEGGDGFTSRTRLDLNRILASYRQRWLRDWLFLEIEPRYGWQKGRFEPDREGVASVRLRLEAVIGERVRD